MADVLGVFEQAVLVAVLRLHGDGYGRTVLREVARRLDRDVNASAVYATLDRLEAKGLVVSRPGDPTPERGGRARRHFTITVAGVRALNETRTAIDVLWAGIPRALKGRP